VRQSGRYVSRYGAAALLTAAALFLRLAFNPILRSQVPFGTFYPAVIISAWFFGRGPGFAAAILSAASVLTFIYPPIGVPVLSNAGQLIGILLFLGFCFVLVALVDTALEGRDKAKRSEADIRSLNEGLTARIRDFETLLHVAPVPLFVTYDRTASNVDMNAAGAELIGMRPGENPSKTGPNAATLPYRVYKDGRELAGESLPLQTAAREGTVIHGEALELLRADGELRHVVAHAAPLYDTEGRIGGAIAALVDVTELTEARAEAGLKAKELARSSEDLRQFAYAASHDLQEPLRTMVSYAQLVQRRYATVLDNDGRVFLDFIVSSGKRLAQLLFDLREYWRVGVSDQNPVQPVNASAALETALANVAAAIGEAGATVTATELPTVMAHDIALVQLFQNLLGNAVKYRSDVPLRIEITGTTTSQMCQFEVKDNGRGIDPRFHDHIFDIFQRFDGSPVSGSGMGLALCRKIVERYDGRIWVESAPGRGSCFRFTLPAVQAAVACGEA
jgi:signal transduction histidine kinase